MATYPGPGDWSLMPAFSAQNPLENEQDSALGAAVNEGSISKYFVLLHSVSVPHHEISHQEIL